VEKLKKKEEDIIRRMQRSAVPVDIEDPEAYDDDGGQRQRQKLVDPGLAASVQREIEERNRMVKEIESDALDILDLYKQIKNLIEYQREHIDNISGNVEGTLASVNEGHKQLEAAAEYQKKAQKKTMLFISYSSGLCSLSCLISFLPSVIVRS